MQSASRLVCIVCLLLGMGSTLHAADSAAGLHYVVRPAKASSAHPPLLILLHGVGSNEQDLFSLADKLPAQYLVVSVQAPYSMGTNQYAWYHVDFSSGTPVYEFSEEEKSRKMLIKFISQIVKQFGADEQKVFLMGFSQGAAMSYGLALTRPDLIAGVAIMSGRLLEEFKKLTAPKELCRRVKYFVSHGTSDNRIGIQSAKDAVAYVQSLGIQPTFKQYNATHEISAEMLADLIAWLQ